MLLHFEVLVIPSCNRAAGVRPVYHAAPSLFLSLRPTPATATVRHATKVLAPRLNAPAPLYIPFKNAHYCFFLPCLRVQAMLCGTGAPPALLGVLGVGDESPGKSQPSEAPEKEGEGGLAQGIPQDEAGVTSAEAATPGEGDEVLRDAGAVAVDEPSRDGEEGGEAEAEEAEAAAVAVRDMPEDVLKVAKECVVYEDVSGVITAVYAARYANQTPAVRGCGCAYCVVPQPKRQEGRAALTIGGVVRPVVVVVCCFR